MFTTVVAGFRRVPVLTVGIAVYVAAYAGFLLLGDSAGGGQLRIWIDALGYVALIGAAIALSIRASRHHRLDPATRQAWRWSPARSHAGSRASSSGSG